MRKAPFQLQMVCYPYAIINGVTRGKSRRAIYAPTYLACLLACLLANALYSVSIFCQSFFTIFSILSQYFPFVKFIILSFD